MSGGYVYEDSPTVIIPDTTQLTQDAPVSELSPCGKTTMVEFLALQEQVLQNTNLLT